MRAYLCGVCDHVYGIGSDGFVLNHPAHEAPDGALHGGAELLELPGHDHVAGVAWHHGLGATPATRAQLLEAFPAAAAASSEATEASPSTTAETHDDAGASDTSDPRPTRRKPRR